MQHLIRIQWFVLLILLQALACNHIHFGWFATPFIYVYFILKFNSGTDIKEVILWAFFMGLGIDILSNTPGLNAAASVFTAFCRSKLLFTFSTRDTSDNFEPGIRTMGGTSFFRYALAAIFIHCTALNILDTFSFANLHLLALKIISDTAITLACALCIDTVRRKG